MQIVVEEKALTEEEKRANKRKNIIQEVIDTEKTYVTLLHTFVEKVVMPVQSQALIDQQTAKTLFTNGLYFLRCLSPILYSGANIES
jgi:hypothetical protein